MIVPDRNSFSKINADLRKVSQDLMEKSKRADTLIGRQLAIAGNVIRNKIITSMRDTPRMLKVYKKGKGGNIQHHPSPPGSPPAIDTGTLVRNILYDVNRLELRVGVIADAPYGLYLEKGTGRMAARPWLEPVVEREKDNLFKGLKVSIDKEYGNIGK